MAAAAYAFHDVGYPVLKSLCDEELENEDDGDGKMDGEVLADMFEFGEADPVDDG